MACYASIHQVTANQGTMTVVILKALTDQLLAFPSVVDVARLKHEQTCRQVNILPFNRPRELGQRGPSEKDNYIPECAQWKTKQRSVLLLYFCFGATPTTSGLCIPLDFDLLQSALTRSFRRGSS